MWFFNNFKLGNFTEKTIPRSMPPVRYSGGADIIGRGGGDVVKGCYYTSSVIIPETIESVRPEESADEGVNENKRLEPLNLDAKKKKKKKKK